MKDSNLHIMGSLEGHERYKATKKKKKKERNTDWKLHKFVDKQWHTYPTNSMIYK